MRDTLKRLTSRRASGLVTGLMLAAVLVPASGCRQAGTSKPTKETPSEDAASTAKTDGIGGKGFNVVFVSVDTTRADHIECYGNKDSRTPNINRMAKEGTRFANCISSAPLTMPSHSTMMTGSYPFVHGVRDNGIFVLNDKNRTLAEIFLDAGYATHAEVAAPVLGEKFGLSQGFEVYRGVRPPKQNKLIARPIRDPDNDGMNASDKPTIEPEVPDVETDRKATDIADCAIKTLNELAAGDKPFFLFLHFFDPHWPFEAPEPFASQFRDDYLAEISYFDSQFGRVLDEIRKLGLSERTLVILVSDHGEGRGEHGENTHSTFLYDTTLHVPLIMWCPGQVPANQVVESQVRSVDLAETVLDFCGMEDSVTPQMQGTSLVPLLADPGRDLHLACYSDTMVPYTSYEFSWLRSLREAGWKYILAPKPELYHVAKDAAELFNLVGSDSDRAETMRQELYDVIKDSPPPPSKNSGLMDMTAQDKRQFEALGYVSDVMITDQSLLSRDELENFEPQGPNPKDRAESIACLATGMGCFRVGEFERSLDIWKRFIELEPDKPNGWSQLGRAYMALERYDEARDALEKAVEIRPEASDDLRMLGNIFAYREDYDNALSFYKSALEHNPDDAIAHLNYGKVLRGRGEYDEALAHFDRGVELEPEFSDAFIERGITLRLMGRTDEAVETLKQGIALGTIDVYGKLQLAGIYLMDEKQPEKAVAYLQSQLDEISGKDASAGENKETEKASLLQALSDCYVTTKDYPQALTYIDQLIALTPDEANPRRLRAQTLVAMGRVDDGIASYREAIELADDFFIARLQLAATLESAGRQSEAREEYQTLVSQSPPQAMAYTRAANLETQFGDFAHAVEILQNGHQTMPRNVNIANDLAWLLATHPDVSVRNGEQAVEVAEAANMAAGGVSPVVLDTLAAAYAEAGRFDDAVKTATEAASLARKEGMKELAGRINARAALYRNHKPYREAPEPPPSESNE